MLDIFLSRVFYISGAGFPLADHPLFVGLHNFAVYGARAMGVMFLALAVVLGLWGRTRVGSRVAGIDAKGWLFLFLALLIGPGLVANVGFKDNWGRARPREVAEFGGSHDYSPFWQPQFDKARSNGSFVSGDGSFGFFLPTFAYMAPRRKTRRFFWGSLGLGSLFGLARLVMGAHFFSDIVFSAFFMLITSALLHAVMFGRRQTLVFWRIWLSGADATIH